MNRSATLLLVVIMLAGIFSLQAQNISQPLKFRLSYNDVISGYIEIKEKEWTKRNPSSQPPAQLSASWRYEADSIYQKQYAGTINWNKTTLDRKRGYDPHTQTILFRSDPFGDILLHVSEPESRRILAEQNHFKFTNPRFVFWGGDSVELRKITVVLPSSKETFTYDREIFTYDREIFADNRGDFDTTIVINVEQPVLGGTITAINPKIDPDPDTPDNVDSIIPRTNHNNSDIYGVIIGNENYKYELPVKYSANDAQTFYQYCIHTLGIPKSHLFLYKDATFGDMLASIGELKNAAKANSGNVRLIFYYSGHGMSDLKDRSMHLIPVDGSSTTLQAALKASYLYQELSDMNARSATVFLDACFSGVSSDGALIALRDGAGLKITPSKESLVGKLVVFSATTAAEIAYPYAEKQHRMFTYFLLKKLQMTKGDVNYHELDAYLNKRVLKYAHDINRKIQTTEVQGSIDVKDSWKNWKLIK